MTRLKHLWHQHRILLLAIVGAAVVTLFFVIRTAIFALYWADPAHRDQQIAGWMTPRYVALSWDVPPEVVAGAIGIETAAGRRLTLRKIAAERGLLADDLAAALAHAIAAHRARP